MRNVSDNYIITIIIIIIIIIVAIAEVYKNEGNDEYKKNNFNNAIQFYTEGIKVNCKDEELNAILYSNRAAARFNLGEKLLLVVLNIFNFFLTIGLFWGPGRVTTAINISSDYVSTVVTEWFCSLFACILSQVITLKQWMMQKLPWAYDHIS